MDSGEFWRLGLVCFAASFIGMILAQTCLAALVWMCGELNREARGLAYGTRPADRAPARKG